MSGERARVIGGERRFAVTTDDGRITAFHEGAAADPTLRVEPIESTFSSVVGAEDHAGDVDRHAVGGVHVSGAGTVRVVEVGTVEIGVEIVRVVSGLFG